MSLHRQAYIDLQSSSVYDHLGVESELLDADGPPTLYLWTGGEAIVIGRNQNPWLEAPCALAEGQPPVVRRVTGGGTVYHGPGNLNFCYALPRDQHDPQQRLQRVAQALQPLTNSTVSVDCQHNLMLDGRKVSGNAFRLTRRRALHHGTLLLAADLDRLRAGLAPMDLGIQTRAIQSRRAPVTNLGLPTLPVVRALLKEWGALAAPTPPPLPAKQTIDHLSSWEWRFGATPPFTAHTKTVRGGIVQQTEERFDLTCVNRELSRPIEEPQ